MDTNKVSKLRENANGLPLTVFQRVDDIYEILFDDNTRGIMATFDECMGWIWGFRAAINWKAAAKLHEAVAKARGADRPPTPLAMY